MNSFLELLAGLSPDAVMIIMTLINIVAILSVCITLLFIDYHRIDSANCDLREKEQKGLFRVSET